MALDALWAVLNLEVSRVSEVQAPIHKRLRDTPAVLTEVSRVSSKDSGGTVTAKAGGAATPDTPAENMRYQRNPPWILGCTLDTPETPQKIINEDYAANRVISDELLSTEPTKPKRLIRYRGPWLTGTEQSAAREYHAHHFNCQVCIAAGRGNRYGERCKVGLALWSNYSKF